MSLKEYIPAIKYGKKLATDEIDDAAIGKAALSYGTTSFTVGVEAYTGTFAVTAGAQILGTYITTSAGSPTIYPLGLSASGTTVTWTMPQCSAGTIGYVCTYLKI